MKKILLTLFAGILFIGGTHVAHGEFSGIDVGTVDKKAVVFFNEACEDCGELVKNFYPEFFAQYGYTIEMRDYVNERENRKILAEYNEKWGVPFELQSHIEAFVGDKLLIGGHVPVSIMKYAMENAGEYDKLLVYQDEMHGTPTFYKIWDFNGEIKTYGISESIATYLKQFKENGGVGSSGGIFKRSRSFFGFLWLVTSSAFLDGLNPCAFAVLLFFIAFLFSIKSTKLKIWKMGLIYIFAIFLAYFLIGIGIAQAFTISGNPHLMAFIGSYLVIALGVIQILGVIFPKFPIRMRIPLDTKATLEKWMYKATVPAAFIGGFLVGLCTFPCSGGIYVAVIGLLSASKTYLNGLAWLIWYNLIFVLPLFVLLALAGNPKTVEKMQILERAESKLMKLIIGAFMIALGLIIILFFT